MKRILIAVAITGLAGALAAPAAAQFSLIPMLGFTLEAYEHTLDPVADEPEARGALLLGIAAEFPVVATTPVAVSVRPGFDFLMIGDGRVRSQDAGFEIDLRVAQSRRQFNADVILELLELGALRPYLGAGLAYVSYSAEFTETETDPIFNEVTVTTWSHSGSAVGVNILAGLIWHLGDFSPLIQARYTIGDPTPDDFEESGLLLAEPFSVMLGVRVRF